VNRQNRPRRNDGEIRRAEYPQQAPSVYAAFFCPALNFAHRARWNAEIFRLADADMVCFATGAAPAVFATPTNTGFDSFFTFAQRAFCARAIRRREAADMTRIGADLVPVGWLVIRDAPVTFSDSMTAIALSNFSTCDCASRRSARSC